ncbi:MAG: hypothetical protein DIZ80_15285 [endosymbiont of Galathealinum brachiosum]|uniref:Outer membrane protein beta-barrel domain-containing protein n=1 Tax=endosymbiont of Galathealinum brachiosum TaxID=2200906 RepID=A0A370DAP9_9GAMM|nr:MAG: hypothetical protein DIZ80_15285 [endosymbiont of Galathealinum brachiosum]
MHHINKIFTLLTALLLSVSLITPVFADNGSTKKGPLLDKGKFSIGAGISLNSVSGPADDEVGFQFFGAYDLTQLKLMDGVDSSVEFGYMDYGFSGADSNGIWGTYVIDGAMSGQFGWLARLGLDLGDDSGFMLGAGLSYAISKKIDTRLEFVARDEVNSLQFNVLYRL